ncbi:MAG: hypothetical protein Q7T70_04990 [Polaromonas sp.]|nr:hypothetical protein [Polaromonas sp.]
MKFRKTDVALLFGVVMIAGPIFLEWSLGLGWYIGALIGVILVSIAGYDAQARLLKMGAPGEDLLERLWAKLRKINKK